MKLRTQIQLFLFLFALLPLLVAVLINLPLVLGGMELFYHKAHLQNLRADFRNLDQHLAGRHETVRLLAKLPGPGIMGPEQNVNNPLIEESIARKRARYTLFINRLLENMPDIMQVIFLDHKGKPLFWLGREEGKEQMQPTVDPPVMPQLELVEAVLKEKWDKVLVSPISVLQADEKTSRVALHLIGPITYQPGLKPIGAAVMTIDIGDMANLYRDTYWVLNDGRYLGKGRAPSNNAFDDFPGLQNIFAENRLALWDQSDEQAIWLPMFPTDTKGVLWVGRRVDPSPLARFANELTFRVLAIIAVLIGITLFAAHWVAKRSDRLSHEVSDGLRRILENNEAVKFEWPRPNELRLLGNRLTNLAEKHQDNLGHLRAHTKALEASNQYKSEFLANVSHELRTPLNSILLLSKLLSEAKLPSEQANQADVIHQASRNLKSLIDNILDMSRIEAGKAAVNIDTIELKGFLHNINGILAPQFEDKGLELELVFEPGAPDILESDSDKVGQIVRNFLANAVKFTDQGKVTLCLHGDRQNKRFPVCISVTDSGIGIPTNKLQHIFDAFQQADGSTSRRYGGSGLGLTISRQLARLLGGDIMVESTVGEGSTFILGLPDSFNGEVPEGRSVSHEPENIADTVTSEPEALDADFSAHGILLIDDDVDSLLHITPILESWGMRVCASAADPEEVAETLEDTTEEECGLVLINCSIPACDLHGTIKAIDEVREERPPIIIMGEETEEIMEAADIVVGAPLQPQQLHDAIAQMIAE